MAGQAIKKFLQVMEVVLLYIYVCVCVCMCVSGYLRVVVFNEFFPVWLCKVCLK